MGKNGASSGEPAKNETLAKPVNLESVEATITSYRSVVSEWLKPSTNKAIKSSSASSNSAQASYQTVSTGRPAR
jgi:hypothetical protein